MKVIIAGPRNITKATAETLVREALSKSGWVQKITHVIHGAAKGIDSAAHDVCEGIWPVTPFPADWNAHGKAAGPIRNKDMANNADALIAVWNGKSTGTKNMIDTATKAGLLVYVHRID